MNEAGDAIQAANIISFNPPPSPQPRSDGWSSSAWKIIGTLTAPDHIGAHDPRWRPRWKWSREDYQRAFANHRRRVVQKVKDDLDAFVRSQLGPEPAPSFWDDEAEDDYDW